MRHINPAGLNLLCEFEGFVDHVYFDLAGLQTIGWGHRARPGEQFGTITREQGLNLLKQDVQSTEVCVSKWCPGTLTDNQFSAIVAFAYNVGVTNFYRSQVLKDIQSDNLDRVPSDLLAWDHVKGVEVDGLKRRRIAEGELWRLQDQNG